MSLLLATTDPEIVLAVGIAIGWAAGYIIGELLGIRAAKR